MAKILAVFGHGHKSVALWVETVLNWTWPGETSPFQIRTGPFFDKAGHEGTFVLDMAVADVIQWYY
jgi:hypothetical protein